MYTSARCYTKFTLTTLIINNTRLFTETNEAILYSEM